MRRTFLAGLPVLLHAFGAHAVTWVIAPDGSGDAPTIQAGIDAASAGDIVLLTCGTFVEGDIDLKSGVTLRGTSPECSIVQGLAGQPILRGQSVHDVRIEDLQLVGGDFRVWLNLSSVEVARCTFRMGDADPAAGRALHANGSTLAVTDCLFDGNRAFGSPVGEGAGILSMDGTLTVANTRFEENEVSGSSSARGGGLRALRTTLDVAACTFLANSAGGDNGAGGVANGVGGGLDAEQGTATIRGSTFHGNTATGQGVGAGADVDRGILATLEDNRFVENTARSGGGLAIQSTDASAVRRCAFVRDHGVLGSAVWCYQSLSDLEECTFLFNDTRAVYGAGFGPPGTILGADRCTWYGTHGSSVYIQVWAEMTVRHSIIANTDGPAADCAFTEPDPVFECSDLWGNAGGDWSGCIASQGTTNGNFSADPRFCAPDGGSLYLQWGSPCLPVATGACGQIGAYGPGGCSTVSVSGESWGKVKAGYR